MFVLFDTDETLALFCYSLLVIVCIAKRNLWRLKLFVLLVILAIACLGVLSTNPEVYSAEFANLVVLPLTQSSVSHCLGCCFSAYQKYQTQP